MTEQSSADERPWHVEAINLQTSKAESFDVVAEDGAAAHAIVNARGLHVISVTEIERAKPVMQALEYQRRNPNFILPERRASLQRYAVFMAFMGWITLGLAAVSLVFLLQGGLFAVLVAIPLATLGVIALGVAHLCHAVSEM